MNARSDLDGKLFDYCPVCGKDLVLRDDLRFRQHGPRHNRCKGSGAPSSVWRPAIVLRARSEA